MIPSALILDHVGLAVVSLDDALPLFESITRARAEPAETIESQGVRVAFLGTGPGRLELLEPLTSDSPVGRFIARRGPGLHHLAYRVADIDDALRHFNDEGYALIDRHPRPGAGGHLVAFLHPRSTGGALIELVQG